MLTVNLLQELLFNMNYSIQYYSFIFTQSNESTYCYVIPIIRFRQTVKEFHALLFNINHSIQHNSFVCTQFKHQTVPFDPLMGSYQVLLLRVRVDMGAMAMKGYCTFFKTTGLNIRWFCFINKTNCRKSYRSAEMQSVYFTAQADWT